ncbi:MAG: sensor histidine kinase [Steroidobacteraceae bacterium]
MGSRREEILRAWRGAVDRDPQLTTGSAITRAQFNDHIPEVLDAFERQLRAHNSTEHAQARAQELESASGHGLHRWQLGYDQRETMCEWGHLQLCLNAEIETYCAKEQDVDIPAIAVARRTLVQMCNDGICASILRYTHLQQSDAASRVRDLEAALTEIKNLEQQRTEIWREAAHDLRGSAHVIASASAVLTRDKIPDTRRTQFAEMLQNAVASLNKLLTDLMDHARLEAGQEQRSVTEFDATEMLKQLCETLRPLATERSLFFKAEGPPSLSVGGDVVKVQRIVQNLVLNALKVTKSGGIKVTWAECGSTARPQWMVCVQDTGPGFARSAATPLARVLKEATVEAHEVEASSSASSQSSSRMEAAPTLHSQTSNHGVQVPSGEGIGLSIVKRLCELLDASIELESGAGEGTTFRVILPRHYRDSAGPSQP